MIQKNKVAVITGVTGQDGAYLSELLLNEGYEVQRIKRHAGLAGTHRAGDQSGAQLRYVEARFP